MKYEWELTEEEKQIKEHLERMEKIANGEIEIQPKIDTHTYLRGKNVVVKERPAISVEEEKVETKPYDIDENIRHDEEVRLSKLAQYSQFNMPGLTDEEVYGMMDHYEQVLYGEMEEARNNGESYDGSEDQVSSYDFFDEGPIW